MLKIWILLDQSWQFLPGGWFIPGFFRGFFRPEETISSSFFRKKVEETNNFSEILYYYTKYLLINYL